METLRQDIRYALRQLGKAPGFACLAIVMLALGIGVNIAMFTVIDSVLIKPLPYRSPSELMVISSGNDISSGLSSWANLKDLQTQLSSFSQVAGFFPDTAVIAASDGGLTVMLIKSTANLPDILGVQPTLGRGFLPEDGHQDAPPVVMLGYTLWRQSFGGNAGIIGQQVRISGIPHTVVGVMPESMHAFFGAEPKNSVWIPLVPTSQFERNRTAKLLFVLGRLKPNISRASAQSEVDAVASRMRVSNPKYNADLRYRVLPLNDAMTSGVRPALWALMGALGLVLLIACANVANLQLARYFGQQQEVAVRAALGAQPGRLVRQFLSAGAVLSLFGSAAGLGLAALLLTAARLLPPDIIPRTEEIHLRSGVLGVLVVVAVICTMLSSLAPALTAMRTNPQRALAGAARTVNTTITRSRLSLWLVGGEVALATVLLIATGLMFRTLWKLSHLELGFNTQVTIFTATAPQSTGPIGNIFAILTGKANRVPSVAPVYSAVLERLRNAPGVHDAALSSAVPLLQSGFQLDFDIPGIPKPAGDQSLGQAELHVVSGRCANVLGIVVAQGRAIQDDDADGRPRVAVINQAFAKRYFPTQDPLGHAIALALGDRRTRAMFTIVGVVHDVPQMQLTQETNPEIDVSYQQVATDSAVYPMLMGTPLSFVVRASDWTDIAPSVRGIFSEVAPGYAADNFRTLESAVREASSGYRLGFGLIGAFGGLAVVMVWAGLYGVLSQIADHRRQEIGLRMALGANRQSILGLILRQAGVVIGLGLGGGLILGIFTSRFLRGFLYGVTPLDAWTYTLVSLGMLVVGLAAAMLPAWRASSIEPMNALRAD
jgi:putative ABC transport system permease protein